VAGTEQCDDGNLGDGDGCDNNCTTTACGNGITTTGEQCDDHNAIDGDGCDNRCVFEPGTPGQCALVRAEWETLLAQPQAMCAHATPNDIPADFAPSLYTLEFQRIVPELANEYPGFAMETWNRLTAWGYLNACGPQGPELWFSTQMTWLLAGESPLRAFVLGLDFTNDPTMPVDPVRPWKSSRFRPPMRVYDSIISFEPTSFSFYVLEKGIARYGVAASSSQYCQ
jgi:cysteine-rich repeat protein